MQWCLSTRNHSKALGDVPGYNRWERLALSYTRDLDMLRVRKRNSLPPPQHHYETKTYQIVQLVYNLYNLDIEIECHALLVLMLLTLMSINNSVAIAKITKWTFGLSLVRSTISRAVARLI